jgi:hypothetical protein
MITCAEELLELSDWEIVCRFLPAKWQEQARISGALRRTRGVKTPEALLRILLIHLSTGCSLAETALRARQAKLGTLSSVAVFKRLQAAEEWLRWLAVEERAMLGKAIPATSLRLRAVDATVVSEPGSTGTDWRLHYAINLTSLQCDHFELTDARGGETWRRIPVAPGDVMMGDRAYANPPGVGHVIDAGGSVVVRMNLHSLPLYDQAGGRLALLTELRKLKSGGTLDIPAWVHYLPRKRVAGRLLAVRRSASATRIARQKLLRRAAKKKHKLSRKAWKAAQYFLLWTSLPARHSAQDILSFYRMRWQIELSFKRLKSIVGLGHLPKTDPASARAWLHGKLLTSLLVERMIETANKISPWGY